jgi:glycosyltransferase involved in cell wall biosynthesis
MQGSENKQGGKYLVSVVVPIRNMANRLENFKRWTRQADILDFQVIAVCNGCKDNTIIELEDFKSLELIKNLIILECKEIGPGKARNFAIPYVLGDYLLFWDADDIGYPKNVLSAIRNSEQFDILVADFKTYEHESGLDFFSLTGNRNEKIKQFSVNPGIWRCIFRFASVSECRFGNSSMGEDQVYLANAFALSPNFLFYSLDIYEYHRNVPGQLTSLKSNIQGLEESVRVIWSVIPKCTGEYLQIIETFYLRQCMTGIKNGGIKTRINLLVSLTKYLCDAINKKSLKKSFHERLVIFFTLLKDVG